MDGLADRAEYSHTQYAPLCLLVYALALTFLGLGALEDELLIRWVFPPVGVLVLIVAASFHHLTVKDQGDRLSISFGPIPLFRRTVRYADIHKVEVGRTTILDGWGIHMSLRGGWVWNLWGWDCVVLHLKNSRLRIGSDDAKSLAEFLKTRASEVGRRS